MAKIKPPYVPAPNAPKIMDYHYTDISAAEAARAQIDREVVELRNSIQDVRNSIKEIRSDLSSSARMLNVSSDGHIVVDSTTNKMLVYNNGKYTEFATRNDMAPTTNAHIEGTDIVFTSDGMRYTIPVRDLVDIQPNLGIDYEAQMRNNWNNELRQVIEDYKQGSVVVITIPTEDKPVYGVVHGINFNTFKSVPALDVQYIHLNDIVDDIKLEDMHVDSVTIYRANQIRFITEQESSKLFKDYVETAINDTKDKIRELKRTLNDLRRLQRKSGSSFKDDVTKRYTEKWFQLLTQREQQAAAMQPQSHGVWPPNG